MHRRQAALAGLSGDAGNGIKSALRFQFLRHAPPMLR
jgi:hypothetical protein